MKHECPKYPIPLGAEAAEDLLRLRDELNMLMTPEPDTSEPLDVECVRDRAVTILYDLQCLTEVMSISWDDLLAEATNAFASAPRD